MVLPAEIVEVVCRYVFKILPDYKLFRSCLFKSRVCFNSSVCYFYFIEFVYSFLLPRAEELGSIIYFIVFGRAEG